MDRPPIARDVVRVAGPDAVSFLQGQLSQDVAALAIGAGAWSFLLQPTGKVDAWLWIARPEADVLTLHVDEGFADVVVARLERFRLRTAVDIERGEGAPAAAILLPGADAALDPDPLDERTRIARGIPRMGAEITPDVIPAELGQAVIDASVSFTKGCYTGQELVARIDSRGGNVPRHLRGVRVLRAPAGAPAAGAPLRVAGEVVGTLTSVAPDGDGHVALAFVHRRVAPPADAEIVAPAGTALPASILELPLEPR